MRARLTPLLVSLVSLVFVWAIWNGYTRGGQDFRVFRYAGTLALAGKWSVLYTEGPDRFLYAPGFAALMTPFAALPPNVALAAWLGLTVTAFALSMRALARRIGWIPVLLAVLFSIRPLAIDLRYGQVNLLILASGVWAMIAWLERNSNRGAGGRIFLAWFLFSIAAFTKIYPLALLLFPLFSISIPALFGASAGAVLLLVPPIFVGGIYPAWLDALSRKGLPTETHNQSLAAFFSRVFGGDSFHSLSLGGETLRFPFGPSSAAFGRTVWFLFSLTVVAALFRLARRNGKMGDRDPLLMGVALAACFLPAHLIWKSYFVLGIPLLAALFFEAKNDEVFFRKLFYPVLSAGIFLAFTSIDFVGPRTSAWIEAVSPFFWIHLALTITGYFRLFSRPSRSV